MSSIVDPFHVQESILEDLDQERLGRQLPWPWDGTATTGHGGTFVTARFAREIGRRPLFAKRPVKICRNVSLGRGLQARSRLAQGI